MHFVSETKKNGYIIEKFELGGEEILYFALQKGKENIIQIAKDKLFFLKWAYDLNKGDGILVQCKLFDTYGVWYDYRVCMVGL